MEPQFWRRPRQVAALGSLSALLLLTGCQAELRPGTVESIPGKQSSASVSVSAAPEAKPAAGGTPAAAATAGNTKGDGVYTPVSNVAIYQLIALDVAAISSLTNAVNDGKPMPSQEILEIYEKAKNAKVGENVRPLRRWATDPNRAKDFPGEAAFYKSDTFLDDPVIAAINGTGSAANLTPGQRRQAIQKGIQRILRYYTVYELMGAETKLKAGNVDPVTGAPHNVDEAWAIYAGAEQDGKYPLSLAATAVSREGNYQRPGTVDQPLREAFARAQKAALNKDLAGWEQAKTDIHSRMNALFYLASTRYLNEAVKAVQSGKPETALVPLAEGFAFYQTIQPAVAKADAEADRAVVAFYQSEPAKLTVAERDKALAAINRTVGALGLKPADQVTPADYK